MIHKLYLPTNTFMSHTTKLWPHMEAPCVLTATFVMPVIRILVTRHSEETDKSNKLSFEFLLPVGSTAGLFFHPGPTALCGRLS